MKKRLAGYLAIGIVGLSCSVDSSHRDFGEYRVKETEGDSDRKLDIDLELLAEDVEDYYSRGIIPEISRDNYRTFLQDVRNSKSSLSDRRLMYGCASFWVRGNKKLYDKIEGEMLNTNVAELEDQTKFLEDEKSKMCLPGN